MKLILDTHTFVWAIGQPAKLSEKARKAIRLPGNELYVSAATAWELAIKFRLGRLPEAGPLLSQFDEITDTLGATMLVIKAQHAISAGGLGWEHRDPFDRMLAAQALRENLTLVTRDSAFAEVRSLKRLW